MVQLLLCEKGVEGPIFSYFVVPDETEIVLFVESGGTVVATVIVSTEPGTCYFFSQLGVEQSKLRAQESPPGIQTDSPRQCFANQVWTGQRTTDLRLRQERYIVRNSMARLEVKSFVTKCLKPLSPIIG